MSYHMRALNSQNKRKVLFVLLPIVSLIFSGCSEKLKAENAVVECMKLQLEQVTDSIDLDGEIVAKDASIVTTETTEVIKKLNVSVGDRVEKGQVICILDTAKIREQYQNKKLKLEKEKVKYEKNILKYDNDKSKMTKSRKKQLVDLQDEIKSAKRIYQEAQEEYDSIKNSPETDSYEIICYEKYSCMMEAKNSLSEYKQRYEQIKLQLDNEIEDADNEKRMYLEDNDYEKIKKDCNNLKKQLSNNTVKANNVGIVSEIYVQEGDTASDGKLLKLVDESQKQIRFHVGVDEAIHIQEGMKVNIYSKENKDKAYSGEIKKISKLAVDSQCEGCVSIHEEVPFIIGMKVSLRVITKVYKDVYKIQVSAVLEDGQDRLAVYIAEPKSNQGEYNLKRVVLKEPILLKNDYIVEASNFKEGDVLVIDADNCFEVEEIVPQFKK